MGTLIGRLGFSQNPFEAYVAENEPNIEGYFVRPPYYATLQSRTHRPSSFLLFGARGAGKSAARLALHKELWAKISRKEKSPIVLTLDTFSAILRHGPEKVDLRSFVEEIGFTLVETILVWLSALSDDDRDVYIKTLTKDEENLLVELTERFYLVRPAAAREVTTRTALQLLDQAWASRTGLWIGKKWGQLAALVSAIAGGFSRKKVGIEGPIDAGLHQLLSPEKTDYNEAAFAKAILERFVECARAVGFSGVLVVVDKIDETQYTSNSVEASAKLLYPVLSTVQLLEISGLGWAFFLWDRLKEPYGSGTLPVRLDKIANATISWNNQFLAELADSRIKYFSESKVDGFAGLCQSATVAKATMNTIISTAMSSPRELIRALDTIVREHDNKHASAIVPPLLDESSIEAGLDVYAIEQIENTFKVPVLRQLFRMNKTSFINKDVQSLFRINNASARNRIRSWADAGLVVKVGERPAEGGVGGKPAHEFSIVDPRVRRVVERGLADRMHIPALGEDEEETGDLDSGEDP